jgi:hypothetical protein
MMQYAQDIMMLDLSPDNFPLMRSTAHSPRKEQMVLAKVRNRGKSRAGMLKALKNLSNGGLHAARFGSRTMVSLSV